MVEGSERDRFQTAASVSGWASGRCLSWTRQYARISGLVGNCGSSVDGRVDAPLRIRSLYRALFVFVIFYRSLVYWLASVHSFRIFPLPTSALGRERDVLLVDAYTRISLSVCRF